MEHFSQKDFSNMSYVHRINLINSCSGYKSANLIGTKSQNGITNLAVFSSVTHLGSDPAMLGFFLRPTTVVRDTYNNIKETSVFTINHIHKSIIEKAHHTSAKYPSEISEFEASELVPEYLNQCHAPFVKDAPIKMALDYVEEYHIKANNTILIVGKITDMYIKEGLLQADGFLDLSKGQIAAINGLDAYAIPSKKTRLAYQRPKSNMNILS